MLAFDTEPARFNARVAGVCLHENHVLLHKAGDADFWALPGGRIEVLETSAAALAREMAEELQVQVAVGPLLWLVEGFFAFAGRRFHELGFYYEMTLPVESPRLGVQHAWHASDGDYPLFFQWHAITSLPHLRLYPAFLRTGLHQLPEATTHLVYEDEEESEGCRGGGIG